MIDWLIDGLIDWLMDWLLDWLIDGWMDGWIDWLIDWFDSTQIQNSLENSKVWWLISILWYSFSLFYFFFLVFFLINNCFEFPSSSVIVSNFLAIDLFPIFTSNHERLRETKSGFYLKVRDGSSSGDTLNWCGGVGGGGVRRSEYIITPADTDTVVIQNPGVAVRLTSPTDTNFPFLHRPENRYAFCVQ